MTRLLKKGGLLASPISLYKDKTTHWAEASAIIYLVAPVFVFFAFFVRISIAIPACLFIVLCLIDIAGKTEWMQGFRPSRQTLYAFSVAAIWLWLAGSFGGLRQNSDWVKHYALLNYLAANSWPATIHVDGLNGNWGVRYSLGWYLVPALVLKYTGLHAQRIVSGLWSLIGLFLFFRTLLGLITARRAQLIVPLVFVVFSGADIIGTALTHFQMGLIYHLEWWDGWIEYGSNMTSLFWVPQHAISVWLGIATLMPQDRRPTLLPYLALMYSAISFWSPFAAIGLAPYGAWLVWRYGVRQIVFSPQAISTVALLTSPIVLYLAAGSGQIPHGFIGTAANRCVLSESAGAPCFSWASYLMFVAVEFAAPAAILLTAKNERKAILVIAIASLVLIPLYKVGAYNDFGMRASMASLAVLASRSGELIATGQRIAVAAMMVALAFGLPTAAGEMARAFTNAPEPDIDSDLTRSLNDHPEVLPQYFAKLPIPVLRTSSGEAATKAVH
ncbi:hypothetical protein LJR230_000903 [Trinickia sp. LjRoot230]|uniref:hypothetical protein n=1 Tax=Trinickia sp. LjRoot230 TaxID=3342288 RepID=UPI003ECE325A